MNSVLVTGASHGSGLRIAEKFAENGYAVFVTSRDGDKAQKSAEYLAERYSVPSKGYELVPGTEEAVKSVMDDIRFNGYLLNALSLNSANLGLNMNPLNVDISEWASVIETNLVWNFTIARCAALQMKERGGGAIVFTSSNTSKRAIKNRSAYIASKGGIISLSKALSVDLGGYGIRVNCVLPGSIKSERWYSCSVENRTMRLARVPIGDIADYNDLAEAVFFLASDSAKNITGAELIVDGGVDSQLFPGC